MKVVAGTGNEIGRKALFDTVVEKGMALGFLIRVYGPMGI